jgi:hypothetical protein
MKMPYETEEQYQAREEARKRDEERKKRETNGPITDRWQVLERFFY